MDLPDPGIELGSLALQVDSLPTELLGKPFIFLVDFQMILTLNDHTRTFPAGSDSKESTYNAEDLGSIPGLGRSLVEKGKATHSSILAWRIPWMEESGPLQSMGSQQVRHN